MKSRNKIFGTGLGSILIKEVEPNSASSFTDLGYLKSITLNIETDIDEVINVRGDREIINYRGQNVNLEFVFLQTSKEEIDFLKDCRDKIYSVKCYGKISGDTSQYFEFENVMFENSLSLSLDSGERIIQAKGMCVKDSLLSYDVPLFYLKETAGVIDTDKCVMWIDAFDKLNLNTEKVLDISGHRNHGTISSTSTYNNFWAENRFNFGNQNQQLNLGSFAIQTTPRFMIEMWIKSGDFAEARFFSKISQTNNTGFSLHDDGGGHIYLVVGDGTDFKEAGFLHEFPTGVWNYLGLYFKPGSMARYQNGTYHGIISGNFTGAEQPINTEDFIFGKYYDGAVNSTEWQLASFRFHLFDNNPTDTEIQNLFIKNYNAEKTRFGL